MYPGVAAGAQQDFVALHPEGVVADGKLRPAHPAYNVLQIPGRLHHLVRRAGAHHDTRGGRPVPRDVEIAGQPYPIAFHICASPRLLG